MPSSTGGFRRLPPACYHRPGLARPPHHHPGLSCLAVPTRPAYLQRVGCLLSNYPRPSTRARTAPGGGSSLSGWSGTTYHGGLPPAPSNRLSCQRQHRCRPRRLPDSEPTPQVSHKSSLVSTPLFHWGFCVVSALTQPGLPGAVYTGRAKTLGFSRVSLDGVCGTRHAAPDGNTGPVSGAAVGPRPGPASGQTPARNTAARNTAGPGCPAACPGGAVHGGVPGPRQGSSPGKASGRPHGESRGRGATGAGGRVTSPHPGPAAQAGRHRGARLLPGPLDPRQVQVGRWAGGPACRPACRVHCAALRCCAARRAVYTVRCTAPRRCAAPSPPPFVRHHGLRCALLRPQGIEVSPGVGPFGAPPIAVGLPGANYGTPKTDMAGPFCSLGNIKSYLVDGTRLTRSARRAGHRGLPATGRVLADWPGAGGACTRRRCDLRAKVGRRLGVAAAKAGVFRKVGTSTGRPTFGNMLMTVPVTTF